MNITLIKALLILVLSTFAASAYSADVLANVFGDLAGFFWEKKLLLLTVLIIVILFMKSKFS